MADAASPPALRPVVLDTNAILLPFRDGTDLEAELTRLLGAHSIVVPASVVDELELLAGSDGKLARAAKAAKALMRRWTTHSTSLPGDDGLLELARSLGAAVVTNDRAIQRECQKAGLCVVSSRGAGRLHMPFQ